MALTSRAYGTDELHPIDIVESLAEHHAWEFDRIAEDQIAMAVVGQWRTYSITLAWSSCDETLRLICTFEMEPPKKRMAELFEMLNSVNDLCWSGNFTWWEEQRLMVFRYGLVMGAEHGVETDQIDTIIGSAVAACERFYPAFQLVTWADRTPADALQVAMAEAYGRA